MKPYNPLFTHLPAERSERWDRLTEFAMFWHAVDCQAIDTMRPMLQTEARLHVTLPDALVEWHSRFGRFVNLWSDRAFTLPMNRLRIDNNVLILRTEAVFNGKLEAKWGIPVQHLENEDPPVVSILGDRQNACAAAVSEFAIYCALFDTINSRHTADIDCDNDVPFPEAGKRAHFPASFGIIKTEIYEGNNWLALVSGTDWYVRRRTPSGADEFIKHELRTEGFPF